MAKPFSPRELTARVRAVLRRVQPASPVNLQPEVEDDDCFFEIDTDKYQISFAGEMLNLSRYEYKLLAFLIGHSGRIYSRRQLMEQVWEEPETSMERTVDTHIKTLRAKLKKIKSDLDIVITHRGFGYSLDERYGE